MDSLYRGPLNSGMQNLVIGLVSLRAYERVEYFRKKFINIVEQTVNATWTYYSVSRFMSFGLDMLCIITITAVAAATIFIYRGKADPA